MCGVYSYVEMGLYLMHLSRDWDWMKMWEVGEDVIDSGIPSRFMEIVIA